MFVIVRPKQNTVFRVANNPFACLIYRIWMRLGFGKFSSLKCSTFAIGDCSVGYQRMLLVVSICVVQISSIVGFSRNHQTGLFPTTTKAQDEAGYSELIRYWVEPRMIDWDDNILRM